MLSANALANVIMSEIKGNVTKANIMQTLPTIGHAIAKYLCRNTDIIYSWAGIMPGTPSVPDPVVVYQTKNVAGDIFLMPTGTLDPVTTGIMLGKQITDGIKTFIITANPAWLVTPGKFRASPDIVLPPTAITEFSQHWLLWATVIINTYKTYINPSPLTGAHGSFLAPPGAGAVMTSIF
jgi:predicted aconitase with swiveling domain